LKKNLSKKALDPEKAEIDLEELKDLIRMLRENNVYEFEYTKGDYHVRILHGDIVERAAAKSTTPSPKIVASEAERAAASIVSQESAPAAVAAGEKLLEVRSPMVGTFYRSSNPEAASFVEVGDIIRKSQVLCIVEAMKIMNEIESDVEGELVKVHVANGQPVEFGEMLFTVRPLT
jgi:acetyl-CoA carboxylase biotin carboxyl carrier protein